MLADISGQLSSNILPIIEDIVDDTHNVAAKEIALLKAEIREELTAAKAAVISSILAGIHIMIGTIFLGLGLAELGLYIFPLLGRWEMYAGLAVFIEFVAVIYLVIGNKKLREVANS